MLIIGHSHINCIADAVRNAGLSTPCINLWVHPDAMTTRENGRILSEEIKTSLTDVVISSVGGGAHHVMGLNPHPQAFDFVAPEQPGLPMIAGATIVPYDQIRQTMRTVGASDFDMLELIGEHAPGRVIHIPPPPTLRDEKPIDHDIWRKLVGDSSRISPAYFRRKLELVHTSILREVCSAADILLAPHPPAAVDAEGFLLPEFVGPPCHGNVLYGALVLEQIRDLTS